ncbi:glycerophosphodiester phosphodiesterase [Rhodobacteraceae bacterium R_SAG1]|nr:glycerophosphodiester phosphodiesterase [Rhodobacteraceae bacterium R_SAG1]
MNTWLKPERPLSIAHRGASAYAAPNSLQAFEFAAALGADMIEVDLHLTRDGHVVVTHDATLSGGGGDCRSYPGRAAQQGIAARCTDPCIGAGPRAGP